MFADMQYEFYLPTPGKKTAEIIEKREKKMFVT